MMLVLSVLTNKLCFTSHHTQVCASGTIVHLSGEIVCKNGGNFLQTNVYLLFQVQKLSQTQMSTSKLNFGTSEDGCVSEQDEKN